MGKAKQQKFNQIMKIYNNNPDEVENNKTNYDENDIKNLPGLSECKTSAYSKMIEDLKNLDTSIVSYSINFIDRTNSSHHQDSKDDIERFEQDIIDIQEKSKE